MKNEEDEIDVFSSMDEILATDDTEYATIKAWGGRNARIGSLTAGQMITFLENNDVPAQRRMNGLLLISQSLVDKNGKRIGSPDDVKRLMTRDAKINGQVVERILELNGLNQKDAKEISKNVSGEVPDGASPSSSRSN